MREHRQQMRRERQVVDNARLQVALERFQLSEIGLGAARFRASLPIHSLLEPLTSSLQFRQVALICGETGCGKSTQVPQMVLEHEISNLRGGGCFILCTQPRRIAAMSLARRVASERGEPLGQQIGYQVSYALCNALLAAPSYPYVVTCKQPAAILT